MSHAAGVTGGYKPPDANTGNRTQVLFLWKSSVCSWPLSHLSITTKIQFLLCPLLNITYVEPLAKVKCMPMCSLRYL